MKQRNLSGFVLARKNLGEADRIIRFYSHDGKLSFVAKGVRKLGSRRAGHLEPFALVKLQLHQGKSLSILTQAQLLSPSPIDTSDLSQVATGYGLLELVDRLLEDDQSVDGLVEVLEGLLSDVGVGSSTNKLLSYLCLYLLHQIGNQPDVSSDIDGSAYFDYQAGIVTTQREPHSEPISLDVVKLWRVLPRLTTAQLTRLRTEDKVYDQSWQLLAKYLEYHFHIRLRSTQLL